MRDFHRFFRFVALFGLASGLIMTGVIDTGFITAYLSPKSPEISVKAFCIAVNPYLSTVYYNIRLGIKNPNKQDVVNYKDLLVLFSLFSRDGKTDLSFHANIPPFYQVPLNTTSFDLIFPRKVKSVGVHGGGNSKKGKGESKSDGDGNILSFRVKAMASVCFGSVCECKFLGDADLDVWCEAIEVADSATARDDTYSCGFEGGPKKCKAELSWFKDY